MSNQSSSYNLSRRDALKTALKGSVYASPVVLGAIVSTPAEAVSPTPTLTPIPTATPVAPTATALPITAPTLTPIPTSPPVVLTVTPLPSSTPTPLPTLTPTPTPSPSVTITPSAGPAGTVFTVTITNFPPSMTGYIQLYMSDDNAPRFPITTDARGSGSATISNLKTTPGFFGVYVSVGNVSEFSGGYIQILAPPFVGKVTVAAANGCYPTEVKGSGFPPGIFLRVSIVDLSGAVIGYDNNVYAQADGTFQSLFNSSVNGSLLPAGPLNAVVEPQANATITTAFTQTACTGTRPIFNPNGYVISSGGLPNVSGSNFPSVGMITISVRNNRGRIVGSITVPETNGSFSGTFGYIVLDSFRYVRLIATATNSNQVLAMIYATVK